MIDPVLALDWELPRGDVDSTAFFGAIAEVFQDATAVCVEGTSIASDVCAALAPFRESGEVPPRETLWPRAAQYRYTFSPAICAVYAQLAACHAELELFDHFFLYAGDRLLLQWPDAFANPIWVSAAVPEERVARFAALVQLSYRRERAA